MTCTIRLIGGAISWCAKMAKRNVYRAIMIAAAKGKGIKLTADEAIQLAEDSAIETVANHTLTDKEFDESWGAGANHWEWWRKQKS